MVASLINAGTRLQTIKPGNEPKGGRHMRQFSFSAFRLLVVVSCLLVGFATQNLSAAITPNGPFDTEALEEPDPAALPFQSSIAYYDDFLIYAGNDGKIYGYAASTSTSTLISDTSSLSTPFSAVQGFLVSSDNYLYFHDNALSSKIYRLDLKGSWPVGYESLDTGVTGAIFAFVENPWTNSIWFSASDFFGSGNNFYLYEIDTTFSSVVLRTSFVQPNSGGNGPIIFKGPNTVLYGEAVFLGNGFFHLLNSTTGELIQENYVTFSGGLADSTYGYNNRIYVTTAGGKKIFELRGINAPLELGTTDDEARGITFADSTFYISEMVPFSGDADDGKISFNKGLDPAFIPEIVPVDPARSRAISDPSPEVFAFQSSIAYYDNYLIYVGKDGKIYGYNLDTGASTVISDTSSLSSPFSAVQGFLVSSDNYLYFHDNALSFKIYRLNLKGTWPVGFESLDTEVKSAIFAFTENPWTKVVYFSSSDFFGSGSNFYLYRVNSNFTDTTLISKFEQPNSGGNGPIIFRDEIDLLYGEAVFSNDGYFHRVNSTTGAVVQRNYLTFTGGVADSTYGYNNRIYITSAGGKGVFEIQGDKKVLIATTKDEARGITFDGASLLISAMVPFSGGADDGEISFLQIWQTRISGVPANQQVDDSVDLNADGIPDNQQPDVILSVNAADGTGSKQIGVSPVGADVVVEALEAINAGTINETTGRPSNLPFELVNYRLKVTSADGTAQVVVYLSEAASQDARWYKYDTINGWLDYSAHATFSADRKSVTLKLEDGGEGDADRLVNGEISDPSGLGVTSTKSSGGGGGGGSGCFILTAFSGTEVFSICQLTVICLAVLLLSLNWTIRRRR